MRTWVFCVLLTVAGHASAGSIAYCVRDTAEFDRAWRAADDDDVIIRMATGTYNMQGSCVDEASYCEVSDHNIEILGGYNNQCSTRVDDPSKTVLTNVNRRMRFGGQDEKLDADIRLSRLTIRDAGEVYFDIEHSTSGNHAVFLDRVWIDRVGQVDSSFYLDQLVIENSVFSNVGIVAFSNVDATVIHSTFVGIPYSLFFWDSDVVLIGNVFSNAGLWMVMGSLSMLNNLVAGRELDDVDIQMESGTITGDPRFMDAVNGNFRLQASSPAINRAPSLLALASDHDGGPRVFGDAGDLGAFETEIGSTAKKLVVTNRNDSGIGSLRQALTDANALPDENTIEFAIGSSCGPHVIRLQSVLPEIREPVRILGYTQPGAQRNTDPHGDNAQRCIVLDGGGGLGTGLRVMTNNNVSTVIDGLAFGGFNLVAVNLQGGNGHEVIGSQFGPAGRLGTLRPNFVGIQAGNFGYGEGFEVRIGGSDVARRNVVSGNDGDGIVVGRGSLGVRVRNNLVGVGNGDENRPNSRGIVVQGRGARIRGNVVGFNRQDGVVVRSTDAQDVLVHENRIGESALCLFGCPASGNLRSGVRVEAGAADNEIMDNIIRNNARDGIVVTGAHRNALRRNVLTDNQQQPIDLGDDGTSAQVNNVSGSLPANSGNEAINRPILASVTGNNGQVMVAGSLASSPGEYSIEFHKGSTCDPAPPVNMPAPAPQGRPSAAIPSPPIIVLDAGNGTSNSTTNFLFSITGAGFVAGDKIMAIATRIVRDAQGGVEYQSSSEVSNCLTYAP
jgi:parallel beta-helix repeat protein